MFNQKTKTFLYALAVLSNTTIGVGMFSLPYIGTHAGLPIMMFYFLILGIAVTIIHLKFADVALKTPDYKRLPGFAGYYLGAKAELIVSICTIVSGLAASVVFMTIGGQFLYSLASPFWGGPMALYAIIYLLAGAFFIFFGINIVQKIAFWGLILFLAIMAVLICGFAPYFNIANLAVHSSGLQNIFLPYGPVLFALWGASSIPEVEEILGREYIKAKFKTVIILSSILAVAVYSIFCFAVIGFTGSATTPSALTGFANLFDGIILKAAFLFGLLSTFISFVIGGLTLKKILHYDLNFSKQAAWVITAFVPLVLYLAGLNNFLAVISFVGAVILGIEGIIILLIYQKVFPQKKILVYPLQILLTGGIIYEIFFFPK